MTVTGAIRGNGSQLATYLLTKGGNENIEVFDIFGTSQPNDLKKSLIEMSLTSELSGRTKMGLYHVQISPRPGEDRQMTREQWIRAAEILEQVRGFAGQKRVMVMHLKDSRLHMHVAWERYHHERGKMIDNKRSRYDQNDARELMEIEFGHIRTAKRNKERPELRKLLSELWRQNLPGNEFVAALSRSGFTVAKEDGRRPFAIVNAVGRSFELVKEIKEAKSKDVRAKLKGIALPDKKTVIRRIRQEQRTRQSEIEKQRKLKELKQQLQRDRDKDKSRGR